MRLELKMIIDFQDQHVEAQPAELGYPAAEKLKIPVGVVPKQM